MRLLFLTSRLPYPPNRGDRLRVFYFIRSLSREHEIHLISFIANEAERTYIPALKEYCEEVHVLPMSSLKSALAVGGNFWRRQPLQALYYRSKGMEKMIDHLIANHEFDAVYVHLFRMAPYVEKHDGLYRIIDLTDVISQELIRSLNFRNGFSKLIYQLEYPRIEKYEQQITNKYEEIWLISDHDRRVLADKCQGANIKVISNGVNTKELYPTDESENPNSLIFVGHMGVFHNVDAVTYLVRDILPRVRSNGFPDVSVKIVGTAPKPEVQALGNEPGVQVTGFVPDLNVVLNQTAIFVAPLRFAAGVQNKVLEAMAAGRAVVTTSIVNRGIGAQNGRDILVVDTPELFSSTVVQLLRNKEMRQRLGKAARAFVKNNYSWDMVLDRMRAIQDMKKIKNTSNGEETDGSRKIPC